MNPKKKPDLWNDGLKLVSFCPLCESHYNPMEARTLGEDEETQLLHIRCRKCSNSILALVLVSASGVSSVGLVTDLSFDDAIRFKSRSKVSVDNVIDINRALLSNDFFSHLANS